MKSRRYGLTSSSTLRAFAVVLSQPGLSWLLAGQLAEIEHELLMRDLNAIADESGGHAVVAPGGIH